MDQSDNISFHNMVLANENHYTAPYVIVYLTLTALSSFVGVCGNIMTIITFAGTKALRETRNFFIINLATADLMVNGIVMPYSIVGTLVGKLYFDLHPMLCRFLSSVCAPGCLASMFTICWISCSRYFFICNYGAYLKHFTRKRTFCYIASIWLLCFLVHSPNHFGWGRSDKYAVGFEICTLDMEVFSYSLFYGCWMIAAISTTFYFYYQIYKAIKSSKLSQKMIAGVCAKGVVDQGTAACGGKASILKHEIKFVKTSFKIFLLFVTFWSPTALLILMGENEYVPKAIYLYGLLLAHSNSTMNFFIYYVDDKHFRKALWTIVKKIFGVKDNQIADITGFYKTEHKK